MKPQVAHRDSASQRQTERLNPTIKILVIDGVLIMPNPRDRAGHLVGNKRTAIDSGSGLDRIDGRSRPGTDGGVIRTVDPTAEKVKLVVPTTLKRR